MLNIGKNKPLPKSAKKVFEGVVYDVWQWEQKLFDGNYTTFECVARADTTKVIGVLPDDSILLIRDEQPHRDKVITPAGGVLEEGESAEEGAKREFMEETGYSIDELVPWYTFQPSSKLILTVYGYIGRGLKKIQQPKPDPGEKIELLKYSFDDFINLGRNDDLFDMELKNLLLEALLDEKKKNELKNLIYG